MATTTELRALLAAATKGPWREVEHALGSIESEGGTQVAQTSQTRAVRTADDHAERLANAALIVAAVNSLPGLLDEIERKPAKNLTYLACPYSHPDPDVRKRRFEAVNKVAGMLMKKGLLVFSPISHTHPIAVECDLPKGWDFWHKYDRAFIEASEKVIVLMLDGWSESVGVKAEIAIATELGIPVEYI